MTQSVWDAFDFNDEERLRERLAQGCDPDEARYDTRPLIYSVDRAWGEGLRLLLAAGASVDAKDERGDTALLRACVVRRSDMVEALLDAGADIEGPNKIGATPLLYACRLGAGYANELSITHQNADGTTEQKTIGADEVRLSYLALVVRLIERGARLDARNPDGCSALHVAVQAGDTDFTRLLLERGADASSADEGGFTSLHDAAAAGRLDLVELLLAHGARREVRVRTGWKDIKEGMTAREVAETRGHVGVAAALGA